MESTTFPYYNYSYEDYNGSTPATVCIKERENLLGAQLSIIYYFMFFFSLFGNGLVLIIIHRFERLSTVTNILLLNLVVSSMIFMSSLPFLGVYMQLSNWIFGKEMCKITGSVYYLGFYSSVLFLTLLTFDRHLAVVYSLSASRVRNHRYAFLSCAVVWLVSGLACIPPMMLENSFFHPMDQKIYCQEYTAPWGTKQAQLILDVKFYLQLFLFLLFPLTIIVYCYVRIAITVIHSKIATKFKTVRLIFVIVILFFICWTPFNILLMVHTSDCEGQEKRDFALHVTRNMAYMYFCISPIFYTFVGKKFQNYFKQMLVKRFPVLKGHISVTPTNRTNMSTKSTPNEL